MEKFKNFFYGKNDILIALLILTAAITLIGYRVTKILEYPNTLVEEQIEQIKVEEERPQVSSSPDGKSKEKDTSKSEYNNGTKEDKDSITKN